MNCWYCYAKPLYARFEWMQEGIGDIGYLAEWELEQPIKRKKPTGIFVCSTYELFHSPDKFARDEIFKTIEQCPQHRFYILTKFPENIDRPLPENCWVGITVEDGFELERRMRSFQKIEATKKFISFEPLLAGILWANYLTEIDWVIVGRLTGHGNKDDPEKRFIVSIVEEARWKQIPVFLKNNLKRIWGEPLIQEFPDG